MRYNSLKFCFFTVLNIVGSIWHTNALLSSPPLTQAALVQKLLRSQLNERRSRSVTTELERQRDPTKEYSQQANFTARFGLQKCSQCQTFAIVGAGR